MQPNDHTDQIHFLQELIDSIPNPIFYKDRDGRYLGCNTAFLAFIGRPSDEVIGKGVHDMAPPDLADTYREMDEHLLREGGTREYETAVLHGDGTRHTVVFHKAVFKSPDGTFGGIVGIIHDITDRKRVENELRISEQKFKLIYEESPIGIELYDSDGNLLEINDACMDIFGVLDREEVRGFKLFDDPNVTADVKNRLLIGETVRYRSPFSFDLVRENGLYRTIKSGIIHTDVIITALAARNGAATAGYLVQVQDITELIKREEELKFLSLHDQLTGLYNRAYFEQEMERVQKSRLNSAGIIVCDLDGLKAINDTLGHQMGDELIKAAAGLIRMSFREGDIVARIGGDEFVAIIPNSSPEVLVTLCQRIGRNIAAYNLLNAGPQVSLSIGAACGLLADKQASDIFSEADANMYAEKASRRAGDGKP